jgi:alpha-ketoglutarate-dependent sulfate ester dioxygenase
MSQPAVDVRRIAGHIGAELTGIRVGPALPDDVVGLIRDALHQHKVIFFLGQEELDDGAQAGFARLFGELTTAHPTVPGTMGTGMSWSLTRSAAAARRTPGIRT